ncbi:MAG: FAD-dependent oxidoreductase [Desulforhopalus sp.]
MNIQTPLATDAILREPASFADNHYDLIVIGCGIYGATLALESVRRGLRCLVVEKNDFGSQTSYNHLRILHGGLRYLQSCDLRRFRESAMERSWYLRYFPDLAAPLDCLMPLYGKGLHRPAVFRAAFALDNILSADRNSQLRPERRLNAGRVLSVKETIARFPAIDQEGLQGSALWQDGFVPDSSRLLIELLRWACRYGAHFLNYCPAVGIEITGGHVTGVRSIDQTDGREYLFKAPLVINATGPWCREVATLANDDRPQLFQHRVLVWNLLFDRPALASCAVAVTAQRSGAHTYFLPPWKGRLLIGTKHVQLMPGEHRPPTETEIALMIDDINEAVPGMELSRHELRRVYHGVMPGTGGIQLAGRSILVDHGVDNGPSGFFSISGVKFTTARHVAERTLKTLFPNHKAQPYNDNFSPSGLHGKRGLGINVTDMESWRLLKMEESVVTLADLVIRRSDLTDWPAPSLAELAPLAVLFGPGDVMQEKELKDLYSVL